MRSCSKNSSLSKPTIRREKNARKLNYENLEKRECLAGDVAVFMFHDHLYVRGDAASNQIQVRSLENGILEIAGEIGTTINGSDHLRIENADARIRGIRVNLGAGDDSVFVEDVRVQNSIHILAGQGADSVGFYQVNVGGDLLVHGGLGNDQISVDEAEISKRLILWGEQGADTLGIDRADVGKTTIISTGIGNDRLSIRNSIHRDSAFLSTLSGDDFVSIDGVQIQGYAVINTGEGNDDVFVSNSGISNRVFADGGLGSDRLEVSSTSNLAVSPRVRNFEGTDVSNEQSRSSAVFNDLIVDGARLGTIVEIASLNPNFSTLVGAVQTTGLTSALAGSGPLTVFAPLNSAFEKIAGVVSGLTTQQLTDVLKFHVVAGAVSSSQLVMMNSVNTLLNQSFSVSTSNGNVVLSGNATLAATDIRAKNGIIHVLNDVLVPVL